MSPLVFGNDQIIACLNGNELICQEMYDQFLGYYYHNDINDQGGGSFDMFMDSIHEVHHHNTIMTTNDNVLYKLGINKFSNQPRRHEQNQQHERYLFQNWEQNDNSGWWLDLWDEFPDYFLNDEFLQANEIPMLILSDDEDDDDENDGNDSIVYYDFDDNIHTLFDDEDLIPLLQKSKHQKKKKKKKKKKPKKKHVKVKVPTDQDGPFAQVDLPTESDGQAVRVEPATNSSPPSSTKKKKRDKNRFFNNMPIMLLSDPNSNEDVNNQSLQIPDQHEQGQDDKPMNLHVAHNDDDSNNNNILNFGFGDPFSIFLNWATVDNPDGVPLVHDAFDQGKCGSCWAFAATGTVEAGAARKAAHEAFLDYLDPNGDNSESISNPASNDERNSSQVDTLPVEAGNHVEKEKKHKKKKHKKKHKHHKRLLTTFKDNDSDNNEDDFVNVKLGRNLNEKTSFMEDAIAYAQEVESEAFHNLTLSIQELIDCDRDDDQGCTGGNPLLAFYFIHRYGLTSWNEYPYIGTKSDTCHVEWTRHPIATVQSWGILPTNREDTIELALRYIGPVAVGFNGAEPSFIGYSGGIYNNLDCDTSSNHALLIVGYGQELAPNGEDVVKYWIARNSWGTDWGENGYVRVQRGVDIEGGICGIAKSPSIALGAHKLPQKLHVSSFDRNNMTLTADSETDILPFVESDDAATRFFHRHRALILGSIAIFCTILLVGWPLSGPFRRRRKKALERRRRQQQLQQNVEIDIALDGKAGSENLQHNGHPTESTPLI